MSMIAVVVAVVLLIALIWAMSQSSLSFGQWLLVLLIAGLVSGGVAVGFMMVVAGGGDMAPGTPPVGPAEPDTVQPRPAESVFVGGLGILICNASAPGVYVMSVEEGSDGERFGIGVSELITHIDDTRVESIDDAAAILETKKAGDRLSISAMSDDGMSGWSGSFRLESDITITR